MKKILFTLILILTACLSHAQSLYGTTAFGGNLGWGTICKLDLATNTLTAAFTFNGGNGISPVGNLMQTSDGKLYGMTEGGGTSVVGVIFSFDPATATFAKLYDFENFEGTSGSNPKGSLVQASDGKLYGMTNRGGIGAGVIFSYDPVTAVYTNLKDFDGTNGGFPYGSLVQASDGKLYGMTSQGGSIGVGVIFSYDPATATFAKLYDFNSTNGGQPQGSLIQATDGKLYGMTSVGGSNTDAVFFPSGAGVIFSFDPATATFAKLYDFEGTNGASPKGSLVQASDGKLYGMTNRGGGSDVGVIFSYDPATATYVKLQDFDYTNGANPVGDLMQTSNGKLYGMTEYGGTSGVGVSFSFDPVTNTCTKLVDFTGINGRYPMASFIELCVPTTYYHDADGDGFGDLNNPTIACLSLIPPGYVTDSSDCDDTKLLYTDNDGDGFGAGSPVACGVANNTDCDDTKLLYADNDGDGFGADSPTACGVEDNTDCNDNNAAVHPGATEICDGKDNNCNGSIDEGVLTTYYRDADNDNYGNAGSSIQNCSLPAGYVTNNTDCNDNDASTHPGAIEICDGKDNNCNGLIDDGCSVVAIAPQPASVNEGNKGKINMTFVVSLSAPAITSCSVNYQTVPVTATAGTDYISVSGMLSFKKGQASKTVVVKINGDTNPEANETFNLVLSNPVNLVISQTTATGTIINDDAAPFAFSSTTQAVTSSKSPGNIQVQIMPNPNKGNFTIQLQLPPKATITTLALYNNIGEKVWQQDAGKISGAVSKNISLQNQLPSGIYILVIRRSDVRLEQKIVISK